MFLTVWGITMGGQSTGTQNDVRRLEPRTADAAATVDRLLHHAHVLVTDGTDSYRLAQATAGKGVVPLA